MRNYDEMTETPEELYHYGVKGMRWGVRRASKQLGRATDSASRDKAVAILNKHRAKSVAKVQKLENRKDALERKLDKSSERDRARAIKLEKKASALDAKAAKYSKKSINYKLKAGKKYFTDSAEKAMIRSDSYSTKADVTKSKADVLHAKAKSYMTNYEKAKAKVDNNVRMTNAFKQGIKDIDAALESKGRRYING